jgi:hypothetical protein
MMRPLLARLCSKQDITLQLLRRGTAAGGSHRPPPFPLLQAGR